MSLESDTMLKKASTVRNVAVEGQLTQTATRFLRHHERVSREEELKRLDAQLNVPPWAQQGATPERMKKIKSRAQELRKEIDEWSPPTDLSGTTRDILAKRLREEEAAYQQGLPTHEEMRRNPVGAVDRYRRHRNNNKDRALVIKNLRLMVEPESEDRDLCNLEPLRPSEMIPTGSSTFMADAQIPGHFAMTPEAKANWPLGPATATTATSHLRVILPDGSEFDIGDGVLNFCADCRKPIAPRSLRCRDCRALYVKQKGVKERVENRKTPYPESAKAKIRQTKRAKRVRRNQRAEAIVMKQFHAEIAKHSAPVADEGTPPDRLATALAYAKGETVTPEE